MYHAGELEAQERAGERSMGERNGRGMTNTIFPGAVHFLEKQPFMIISSQNNNGELFASMLYCENVNLKVIFPETLNLDTKLINPSPHAPFWNNINTQPKTGM